MQCHHILFSFFLIFFTDFYWSCHSMTHLLFTPSSLSHDSNANHIPSNGVSGHYFISGAEQDRLMNIWWVQRDLFEPADWSGVLVYSSVPDKRGVLGQKPKEAAIPVKLSCDTSQPSPKCTSPASLPPLNVTFRNSSSQCCEPRLRGQGGEIRPI